MFRVACSDVYTYVTFARTGCPGYAGSRRDNFTKTVEKHVRVDDDSTGTRVPPPAFRDAFSFLNAKKRIHVCVASGSGQIFLFPSLSLSLSLFFSFPSTNTAIVAGRAIQARMRKAGEIVYELTDFNISFSFHRLNLFHSIVYLLIGPSCIFYL